MVISFETLCCFLIMNSARSFESRYLKIQMAYELRHIFVDAIILLTYCDFVGFKVDSLTRWKTFFISTSIPIVKIILKNMLNTSDFIIVIATTKFFKAIKSHKNAIAASTLI